MTEVVGLFPALDATGGVEESGRVAWDAVLSAVGPESARLVCLGGLPANAPVKGSFASRSKVDAVRNALRVRTSSGVVLVWHLGLVKLLPAVAGRRSKVALYLHGREAWAKSGYYTSALLRKVDVFLTNTDHTWERFLRSHPGVPRDRHTTVNLGVGSIPADVPEPLDPPAAVMVARLGRGVVYKGHRELLEVWEGVRERVPGARLWIVGDGEERIDLQRAYGAVPGVTFWGRLDEADKEARLAEARCLALPSRGEGFGLVYLEAMRLSRPCLVGTDDAGSEVVGSGGLAVDVSDPDALVDATARLLTPGAEWRRLSVAARERYASRFTEAHFKSRLLAALGLSA